MPTEMDYPEGHDVVLSKGPCPECGSKDNLVTYADGHTHCFSPGCGHHTAALGQDQANEARPGGLGVPHRDTARATQGSGLLDPRDFPGAFRDLGRRKLKADTLRRYGYFIGRYSGQDVHVAPYHDQEGELANQKLRWPNKEFTVLKAPNAQDLSKCRLFGHHVFGDKYDRTVVITEGELDALSVAQACSFKMPVVSVNGGAASAAKCLKANYLWLDRYSQIILWFDDDEPGRIATEECAKLFKVGKVRIARLAGCKDASDGLQQDRPGDVEAAVYGASAWRPRGIVNAKERVSDVLAPTTKALSFSYPEAMVNLQAMTGGMHLGEVWYHVAGTGVGKSTALREIEFHLIEQDVKIGILSFEDTVRDAKFGLMSIKESQRLHLLPVPEPEDEKLRSFYDSRMARVHAEVFGGGLVELFDPETAEWSMEAILGYIRYCAKALDCKVIFVDPISFVAAGIDLTADERRVLDKVAGEFAKLAKELDVHLQISHHLKRTQGVPHEEGAPTSLNELRSSGGLANFAMGVIGWERNNQAAGEAWRVTRSRIIKPSRRTGKSGVADVLYYGDNGRLVQSAIPFPPIGKPEGANDNRHHQGFGPIAAGRNDY